MPIGLGDGGTAASGEQVDELALLRRNARELICRHLLDGTMVYASPSSALILGRDPATLVGTALAELAHPDEIALLQAATRRAAGRGPGADPVGMRCRAKHADGHWVWLDVAVRAVRDDATGKVWAFDTAAHDVTERVETDRERQNADRRLQALLDGSDEVILVIGGTGRMTYVSPNLGRVFGYEIPDGLVLDHDISLVVHPDDHAWVAEVFRDVSFGPFGGERTMSVRAYCGDGSLKRVEARVRNLFDVPAVRGIVVNVRDLTESDQLRERSEALMASSSDVTLVLDADGRTVFVSPSIERWTGWRPEQVTAMTRELVHPDDVERLLGAIAEAASTRAVVNTRYRYEAADGTYRVFDARLTDMQDHPAVGGIVVNARDMSELDAAERRFQALVQHSQEATIIVGAIDRLVTYASPAVAEVFGADPVALLGHPIPRERVHPEDHKLLPQRSVYGDDGSRVHEYRYRHHQTDEWRWIETTTTDLRAVPGVEGIVYISRDVTERQQAREALLHQALHDPLTALPNRLHLTDALEQAVARAERRGSEVTVLFCDLDRFKLVNDGLGHAVGDAVLQEAAARLAHCVRSSDTVGRFGGDEFVVIAEDPDGPGIIATRIVHAFRKPFTIDGQELHVRITVGSAVSAPGLGADEILRRADVALYAAKDGGRNRHVSFSTEVEALTTDRLALENDLRRAVDGSELVLHYQPIVDLHTSETVAVEALVRWQHPERGLLPPSTFIPLAEEMGLIGLLGEWVLDQAAREAARWERAGRETVVSVNVSADQLDDNLAGHVARALYRWDLSPRLLALEITETAAGQGVVPMHVVEALDSLGVQLSIDDFGTGYSSLSRLHRIPVTSIKIDGSFIAGLENDEGDRAVVAAIVTLAEQYGFEVVAECVETEAQRAALMALGVRRGQGWLFGRPVPAAELILPVRERAA